MLVLHEILYPMRDLEPVKLELDEILMVKARTGDPKQATTLDEEEREAKKKERRKKKKRSRQVETVDVVQRLIGKQTVDKGDSSHIERGLWAVDSFNPNAWGGATEILAASAADFAAVQ